MKTLAGLIHRRVTWAVLLPAFLLCFLLMGIGVVEAFRNEIGRARALGAMQAHMVGQVLELQRSSWDIRLRRLLTVPRPETYIALWQQRVPEFCLLSLWDSSGSMSGSWPRREMLRPPDPGREAWTDVETNPRCEGGVVRTRIALDSGRSGVVTLRLKELSRRIEPIRDPGGAVGMVVVDAAGTPVLRWDGGSMAASDPQGWLAARHGRSEGAYRDGSQIVAWSATRVPTTPWILVVRLRVADILRQMLPLFVALAAAFVGVLLIARRQTGVVTKSVIAPLAQMTDSIHKLELERWDGRLPGSELREIDDLSRAFDQMAERVAERETARRGVLEGRSAELERALREMETFSYSVSHDLRTPLRAIHSFSRILEVDAGERLLPDEKESLHRIRRAAGRMAELTDDIVDLARAARTSPVLRPIDMGAMAREIAEGLSEADTARVVEWDFGDLGSAMGDVAMIRQVWINILSNAFKFTARTERARVAVRSRREERTVVWTVADNGVGFDRAAATRLFQPFWRMHDAEDFPGTGVGLAIVQRILERHGGRVEIDSEPGKGTRVAFSLPVVRAEGGA